MTISIRRIIFLIALVASTNSFAQNSNLEAVKIITNALDAIVYMNDTAVGKGDTVEVQLSKNLTQVRVKVMREGYKTEYATIMIYRDPKRNFPPEIKIECKTPLIKRAGDQKYIQLPKVNFILKKENRHIRFIDYNRYTDSTRYAKIKKRIDRFYEDKPELIVKKDLNIESSILKLNTVLVTLGYTDTINTLLKDFSNTLYLRANIKYLETNYICPTGTSNPVFVESIASIEWEIMDYYEQSKYKTVIESVSVGMESIEFSVEDLLTISFFQLLKIKDVEKLMQKESPLTNRFPLKISFPKKAINNLDDAMAATVAVKSANGYGSGCIISNNGYILTNYHIVVGSESIEIIQENMKLKATLIRMNRIADLAVLKVDTIFNFAFQLTPDKNFEIGNDVFVIGTPKSIAWGQSISKGVISAIRKSGYGDLIQTDASINPGNSGGPMVDKNGNFIGVVNGKIVGPGVEGLGFGIPSYKIFEYLSINY